MAQQWFLGDEFKKLKQKFEPIDYSEYLKKQKNKGKKGKIDERLEKISPPRTQKPNDSVRYTCPVCKGDQYKEDKGFHKK